jgi:hypothetical protein
VKQVARMHGRTRRVAANSVQHLSSFRSTTTTPLLPHPGRRQRQRRLQQQRQKDPRRLGLLGRFGGAHRVPTTPALKQITQPLARRARLD